MYEKQVARKLRRLFPHARTQSNPWFKYEDELGDGWASPDILMEFQAFVLLGECKRTFQEEAMRKLDEFYLPIVTELFPGKKILRVQFAKNLSPAAKGLRLVHIMEAVAELPRSPQLCFWPKP